ncbi:MAG: DUF2798 domain-containing protein [Pseudomonadota bacterium]
MHLAAKPLKIPARLAPVLFAFIMSATLGGVMSAIITAVNTGFSDGYLTRWLHTYALAFSLAFPSVTFIAPVVRRFVDRHTFRTGEKP